MPYIYKYTDRRDGVVKYVGIITKETNFPKRFYQHRNDPWAVDGNWMYFDIHYAYFVSETDVRTLEAHLIWKYKTYEYYNKAKNDWGPCSFAPDENGIEWTAFIAKDNTPKERLTSIQNTIKSLEREIQDLWRQYEICREDVKHQFYRSWNGYENEWEEKEA